MKFVRTAVVATFGATLALLPVAAQADSYTQIDGTGDVYQTPVGQSTYVASPTRADGDVAWTRVTHHGRTVKVVIGFRDLTHAGPNLQVLDFRTNRRNREVSVLAYAGQWQGKAKMTTMKDQKVRCSVRHTLDYVRHRAVVVVPRSCLGNPRWVQVAVNSYTSDKVNAYADDARSKRFPDYLVYGPKVRR